MKRGNTSDAQNYLVQKTFWKSIMLMSSVINSNIAQRYTFEYASEMLTA